MVLELDKKEYVQFVKIRNYEPSETRIDQYLVNNCNKTELKPLNIDMEKVISQYTKEQIEDTVNFYLKQENKAWK